MTLEQIARQWAEEHNATRQKTYLAGMMRMVELVMRMVVKEYGPNSYVAIELKRIINGGEIGE